jgi:hypothetical protein
LFGLLAVAARATGKVHLFNVADPTHLVPVREIGRGDGPFGPLVPDRFLFQKAPDFPGAHVALALSAKGELAVVDRNRLLVFDEQGTPRWSAFGLSGGGTAPAFDDPERAFEFDGQLSLRLNERYGSWSPEAFWNVKVRGKFLGTFADGGHTFGAFITETPTMVAFSLTIARYEGYTAKPVLTFLREPTKQTFLARTDTNGDGKLDDRDRARPLRDSPDAIPGNALFPAGGKLQPNGDVLALYPTPVSWGIVLRRSGLDAQGIPVYRMEHRRLLTRSKRPLISPYTLEPDETKAGIFGATLADDGGFYGTVHLRSSPERTGLADNAGTDLCGFDSHGNLRWLHSLSRYRGLMGLSTVGGLTATGQYTTAEILLFNADGLGLGSFGQTPQVHYQGYFLDSPDAVRIYRGRDGQTYALIADIYNGRHHWYRLEGADRIAASKQPVVLGPDAATALAALPGSPAPVIRRPAPPKVRIPKLADALPIDGDLDKWRRLRLTPQIVVTTDTGGTGIDGPADCCAVIRLAYHGDDLYAQFLVFDDVVSFHQTNAKHFMQDGVEICLNGFMPGFKFDVSMLTDTGPTVWRNRFYYANLGLALPESHAPRVIKVLDNARAVEERKLIEDVYGVDLSANRVIVTEFKLPIDATTYRDSPDALKAITPWRSGMEFWLGFLINDNDEPGTDQQNYLVWPATYGNFNPVEDGARAVLE